MLNRSNLPEIVRERRLLRTLWRDAKAVVVIEFAYSLPILMMLAFTAVELTNLAIVNMRVSQMTLTVADNLSRAMQSVPQNAPRIREIDINDALLGANIQGGNLRVLDNGRIVVSSLQVDASNRQTIFWQRCKGVLAVNSAYGAQGATQGATPGFTGMGSAPVVQAPANSAIIFAELTYDYQPLVGSWALGDYRIRKEAAYFVRDNRSLTLAPENPIPVANASTCDKHDTSFV